MTKRDYEWNTSGLGDAVKEAKRASLLKTVVTSLVVTASVIIAVYAAGSWMLQKKIESVGELDMAIENVRGANIEPGGSSYTYSFLTAVETRERQKIIEGIPISWGTISQTIYPVGDPQKQVAFSAFGQVESGSDQPVLYYNGERLMEFYHPQISYETLPDDRSLLEKLDSGKVAELGLSFDRPYTLEEIGDFLPGNPVWLWVDEGHSGEEESMSISAESAAGFSLWKDQPAEDAASDFIAALQFLKAKGQADELYQKLSKGENGLDPKDLRIIGAVVTGSTKDLEVFEDLPQIRAVTLGATVDRY